MANEDNEKSSIWMKELVLILISAILSGFLSLHVFLIYQNNNNQLPEVNLKFIGILFLVALNYLVYIILGIVLIVISVKLLEKYGSLINETVNRILKPLVDKLSFKKKRTNPFKIPKKYTKEIGNLIVLSLFLYLWIISLELFSEALGWIYWAILIVTIVTILDRIRLLFK